MMRRLILILLFVRVTRTTGPGGAFILIELVIFRKTISLVGLSNFSMECSLSTTERHVLATENDGTDEKTV